ncbi:hypothetical protein BRYFOR_08265 [Marvinbryantia formatexigens DSM 14469]|uniref:Uncharacterized protein n=1 Tax=Marvinbryantia formatexigens DSM 14469 TaxID=478749 RepID=C6LHZ4_9FIRM|nr:hypothetical protein BRYFOR_08265 [Marvinbryantia formatexigens DSM 14469]
MNAFSYKTIVNLLILLYDIFMKVRSGWFTMWTGLIFRNILSGTSQAPDRFRKGIEWI